MDRASQCWAPFFRQCQRSIRIQTPLSDTKRIIIITITKTAIVKIKVKYQRVALNTDLHEDKTLCRSFFVSGEDSM